MTAIFTVLGVIILVLIFLPMFFSSVYSVQQQNVVIVERFGRFHKIQEPGLRAKVPFIDRKADILDLRVQQLDLKVETKTKDNVFVEIALSVQYQINPDRVYDAYYKLSDVKRQMTSYVYDTIRASVPKLLLDEAFERKDDIAQAVAETMGKEMSEFGYEIVKTLVSDVNPDAKVKASMNEINAAQRNRDAAVSLAQAEKIQTVTRAEARAEAQRLDGVGIANQRKAIVEGFAEQFAGLQSAGIDQKSVIDIILMTQYFDTMNAMANKGVNTIMLPSNPAGITDLMTQVQQGVITGSTVANAAKAADQK